MSARSAAIPPKPATRRIQVRKSGVHGKGVFALQDIPEGERLIEYVGEIISWKEAQRRHPWNPEDPNHTFYFHVDEKRVIDAAYGGNASRWINHSCDPNCEAAHLESDSGKKRKDRIYIEAMRDIAPGEELTYNYGITLAEPHTARLKKLWACRCGAKNCTGTMLQPKRKAKS